MNLQVFKHVGGDKCDFFSDFDIDLFDVIGLDYVKGEETTPRQTPGSKEVQRPKRKGDIAKLHLLGELVGATGFSRKYDVIPLNRP